MQVSWNLNIRGQEVGTSDSTPKYHAFDSDSDDDEETAEAKRKASKAKSAGVSESKGADDSAGEFPAATHLCAAQCNAVQCSAPGPRLFARSSFC